jgi:hypothetical protein
MNIQGVTLNGVIVTDAQVVTSGLQYYIDAGNVSSYSGSGTTINNISGSAAGAATLYNTPTFTSAGQSSYFTFDGSTQYAMTNNLLSTVGANSVTLETWVYTTSDNGVAVSEQGTNPPNSNWYDSQIEIVSGNLKVAMWPYSIGGGVVVGSVTRSAWQQYTLVYNSSTTTVTGYINGSTSSSYNNNRSFGGAGLYYDIMGGTATNLGDGSYLAGRWSIFRAYNRALSVQEIQQNFNATRGRYGL